VQASASRVLGSDQTRIRLRSQIWSTSIYLNPPSLWITINPCDLHDPIAQIFAGEEIDIDNFVATIGPSKTKRAENIANDPYAEGAQADHEARSVGRCCSVFWHGRVAKARDTSPSFDGVVEERALFVPTFERLQRVLRRKTM